MLVRGVGLGRRLKTLPRAERLHGAFRHFSRCTSSIVLRMTLSYVLKFKTYVYTSRARKGMQRICEFHEDVEYCPACYSERIENNVQGVYVIRNVMNDRAYVGQSEDIRCRWRNHFSRAGGGAELLTADIRSYGPDAFRMTIHSLHPGQTLNDVECAKVEENNALTPNGYNMTPGGGHTPWMERMLTRSSDVRQDLRLRFDRGVLKWAFKKRWITRKMKTVYYQDEDKTVQINGIILKRAHVVR